MDATYTHSHTTYTQTLTHFNSHNIHTHTHTLSQHTHSPTTHINSLTHNMHTLTRRAHTRTFEFPQPTHTQHITQKHRRTPIFKHSVVLQSTFYNTQLYNIQDHTQYRTYICTHLLEATNNFDEDVIKLSKIKCIFKTDLEVFT